MVTLAPRTTADPSTPERTRRLLLAGGAALAGTVAVAATYGAVGVLLGSRLPQLSPEMVGGVPARLLQALGNVLLVAALAVAVVAGTRGAAPRWLARHPGAASAIAGAALLALGVFMLVYWDLRLPARFRLRLVPCNAVELMTLPQRRDAAGGSVTTNSATTRPDRTEVMTCSAT